MIRKLQEIVRRFAASPTGMTALAGYAAMVSSMVVGLFSVPMALQFLSKSEFGLWNIVGQSLGYLLLLDFGVTSSASRMLVGPLRAGNERELSSWWTVLVTVLVTQAVMVLGIGWFFRELILEHFFDVPPDLYPSAEALWGGMILINAIQLPFRAYSGVLHCQNRWYIMHVTSIISAWVNLAVFLGLLYAGFRTSAYVVASALSVGCNVVLWWVAIRKSNVRLRIRPSLFSKEKLRELFGFSGGVFLVSLAAQVTNMSQNIIIGKVLGLGAVAAFVVSCKSSTIALQLTRRAFDAYTPRWMQLYVDGNPQIICEQWRRVMSWFIPVGIIAAVGVLILNRSFSMKYGGWDNHEGRLFDLMRSSWILLQTFLFTLYFIFPLASKVKAWAIVNLVDGVVQLILTVLFTRWMGGAGLMLGSMLGSALTSLPFMVIRGPETLGVSRADLLDGIGKQYALGFLAIAVCYGFLSLPGGSSPGWWPTPIEITLATGLVATCVVLLARKGSGIFQSAKKMEV